MDVNEYQKLAMTTLNKELNKDEILLNSAMGLCGEAGEVIDILKKHLHQGHPFDKEAFINELGDIAWYLAEASYAIGENLDFILEQNLAKLRKRYPEGFSVNDSIIRVDDK